MPLPAAVVLVPVVAGYVYRDASGSLPAGKRVVFVARTKSVVVDDEIVTLPKKLEAIITAAGELPEDFALPTCGDDGIYYDVHETFPGGREVFTILVLPTDTEINLATVAPVVPVEPMAAFVELGDFELLQEQVDDLATVVGELDLFPGALNGAQWDTTTRLRVGDLDYAAVGVVISSQGVSFEAVSGYSATLLGPAGILAGDAAIRLPAESGTIALLGDLDDAIEPLETAVYALGATFASPASVAGVLTLNFSGRRKAVFATTLTENITSIVLTNVPAGVPLELEIHYTQGGAGTYTVAQPASFKALGGSDTVVATTVGKVTVQSASSVDSGTTWRYAMQESA